MMERIEAWADLAGRVLISVIFVLAGFNKIGGYAGTQAHMENHGVPGELLPLVILLEAGGGLLIIAGFQTRVVAFLLAGFCVLAAVLFHGDFSQRSESIAFMKNLAIAGGFLFLVARGAGPLSIDARRAATGAGAKS